MAALIQESPSERLHALDAVRAGALLLGVVFHASLSFLPNPQIWFVRDVQSVELGVFFFVAHIFRMTLFFLIAGFFARMLLERRGVGGFVRDRAKRILLPLTVFWPILFGAIVACFIWGYVATHPEAATAAPPPPPPPMTAQTFPLTHLWFLYVLVILYAGALLLRGLVMAVDRKGAFRSGVVDKVITFLVKTPIAPFVLAAPLFAALALKPDWMMWFGVPTPDTGLVPNTPAMIAFGTAFGFGWLLNRQIDLLRVWERNWLLNLGFALILTVTCLVIAGPAPIITPAAQDWKKLAFAGAYTLAIWAWTFALIGMALRFLSERNPVIRYVADASYWIYLIHLPIVMALQVLVLPLAWPWFAKFALLLWIAFSLMFLSYHYLVRYSFLGAILNGRKHKRRAKSETQTALAAAE
jgi:glucans biosynthesis protein C